MPFTVLPTEDEPGIYYSPDPADFQVRYAPDQAGGGIAAIVSADIATWAPVTGWGVNHQAALEDLVRQMSARYQEDRDTIRYCIRQMAQQEKPA